jgi:uncharacterized protein YecE (DUF72 family)
VRSVEINGSFYSLQRPSSYRAWHDATPDDFVFAVKGGRFISHNKKLRDCLQPLANFFASGVLGLGEKLGPILWQLPPQLPFDAQRLEDFFALLPRTAAAAAELASHHDHRLKHGALLDPGGRGNRGLRYAIEVRHETYAVPAFLDVLRRHSIAVCVADTAGRWPFLEEATTDFVYVRLHGDERLYVSGYGPAALDRWARRASRWRDEGRDVYVYFDNDVKVRAPYDAMNLAARLGQGERVPFPRKALREAERERGVEEPRTTWDRWQYGARQPR